MHKIMHYFSELATQAVKSSLNSFAESNKSYSNQLQKIGSTHLVKGIRRLQWQKAMIVTGLFSLYDAELQRELSCRNGFRECKKILIENNKIKMLREFETYQLAVNVLKHGKGRSYEKLVANHKTLPFNIRRPDESFFDEGDISEISTLIEIDDNFVLNCANIVRKVSQYLRDKGFFV